MKARSNRIWFIALALGWCFDLLFWKQTPGINFFIYVILCLAGGFLVMHINEIKPAKSSIALLIPIVFFAVVPIIRQETMTMFLAFIFCLFLMGVLVVTLTGGRWIDFGLADYLSAFIRMAGGFLTKPFILNAKNSSNNEPEMKDKKNNIWPIIRGVLIAIPVVAIFSTLLSSADVVFAQQLDAFIQIFRLENLPEYLFRISYILVGAYLLVGVFLHAALSSQNEKLIGEDKPLVPTFLGFIESSIILGSVGILFTIFVIIQFQYFFGGQANIHIAGYTYAEYARKGFGELITVAVFSLILFLGLSGITQRENSVRRKIFSGLGMAIVILVGIMLVSAYQRLVLYENAYGFSQLRTYTHVFMMWLGLLLVVVVGLELIHKERRFALAVLLAGIGFASSLAMLNVDGFIVRQNVERAINGQKLDVAYLASLTSDSIPALVERFYDPDIPEEIHEQLGATLICMENKNSRRENIDWRSFQYSYSKGKKMLEGIKTNLAAYKIEGSYLVTTPSGEKIECWKNNWID
jgi:hypothetical protein